MLPLSWHPNGEARKPVRTRVAQHYQQAPSTDGSGRHETTVASNIAAMAAIFGVYCSAALESVPL